MGMPDRSVVEVGQVELCQDARLGEQVDPDDQAVDDGEVEADPRDPPWPRRRRTCRRRARDVPPWLSRRRVRATASAPLEALVAAALRSVRCSSKRRARRSSPSTGRQHPLLGSVIPVTSRDRPMRHHRNEGAFHDPGPETVIYPVTAWAAASGCSYVPPRTATTTVGGYLRVTEWCHRGVTRIGPTRPGLRASRTVGWLA